MSRLKDLETLGQSIWLDYLTRGMIENGELATLIEADGIRGMTSNPAIFEKAIGGGEEYDDDIKRYVDEGEDVGQIFRHLAVHDIRLAADALRPVYDATKGGDGFISMEVSPYLAGDTAATMDEALSLWREIDRPNLMIKVPATEAGLPAIRDLTAKGLNINITLLFSCDVYTQVAEAYIEGLEQRPPDADLSQIASVASFFVSRIDSKIDAAIDKTLETAGPSESAALAKLATLRGKVAIANAKRAYNEIYKEIFAGPRWDKLAARGAKPQRLLWASTGTKNKAYSDVLYVDTLIGPDTVNTMPPQTMDAFRDHGTVKPALEEDMDDAKAVLAALEEGGISLDTATAELVSEGVDKFADAADKLYAALAVKRLKLLDGSIAKLSETLGPAEDTVTAEIAEWTHWGNGRRLWARDKTLWTNGDENEWLGWLDIAQRERADLSQLAQFAKEIDASHSSDVVLLGMGGSSLGTAVLHECFGQRQGWPRLHVLDSTDPDQIRALEDRIVPQATKFIVASKSGTTLEPNILKDYFWDRAKAANGKAAPGAQFVAITDPASALEKRAKDDGFAHVFLGDPAVGGRFSVLSKFGLVPAAAMGLDLERFLNETKRMITSCGPLVPPEANPGIRLGVTLGTLAAECGRDKITIVAGDGLETTGTWLEQLIAESTGKNGKGLIPVDREALGDPDAYGNDRVFVHLRLAGVDKGEELLGGLEKRGHPVIRIVAEDSYQLGQLFFLWEIAVAVAGSIIGINPFDQPDVEASKVKARALTDEYEKTGALPQDPPIYRSDGIALYADEANAAALGRHNDLAGYLKAHLARLEAGDYFALLAFIEQCEAHEAPLQEMRAKLRDAKKTATCLGFGPRFLHSTGQAYKGGPNTGVFLTITGEHERDIEVPGRNVTFGAVERAQALGDFAVLNERGRRAMRLHLKDVKAGLAQLGEVFGAALQ
jgi:transaldolase/glucose-6-phosphate isomerase